MTMHTLKIKIEASMNMLKGFCCNGIRCNGYIQPSEQEIKFMQTDGRIVRVMLDNVADVGTCWLYDEREGRRLPFANVVTHV